MGYKKEATAGENITTCARTVENTRPRRRIAENQTRQQSTEKMTQDQRQTRRGVGRAAQVKMLMEQSYQEDCAAAREKARADFLADSENPEPATKGMGRGAALLYNLKMSEQRQAEEQQRRNEAAFSRMRLAPEQPETEPADEAAIVSEEIVIVPPTDVTGWARGLDVRRVVATSFRGQLRLKEEARRPGGGMTRRVVDAAFTCRECGLRFRDFFNGMKHQARCQEGDQAHWCPVCEYPVGRAPTVTTHLREVHGWKYPAGEKLPETFQELERIGTQFVPEKPTDMGRQRIRGWWIEHRAGERLPDPLAPLGHSWQETGFATETQKRMRKACDAWKARRPEATE